MKEEILRVWWVWWVWWVVSFAFTEFSFLCFYVFYGIPYLYSFFFLLINDCFYIGFFFSFLFTLDPSPSPHNVPNISHIFILIIHNHPLLTGKDLMEFMNL